MAGLHFSGKENVMKKYLILLSAALLAVSFNVAAGAFDEGYQHMYGEKPPMDMGCMGQGECNGGGHNGGGGHHTPEVPLPAALWLFAPALAGFVGLRRKAKSAVK